MTTNWLFKWSIPMCMAVAVACSSDDKEQPSEPTFPEKQTLEVAAGQTYELRFDAEREWRMTSDKAWVRFIMDNDGQELPVAYGSGGENTLTIVMKENGWAFDTESALLSLTMDNYSQPVFELTRPAKERSVKMTVKYHTQQSGYDTQIDISFADRTRYQIGFEANFDWKILSHPKWLKALSVITGDANVAASKLERIAIADESIPFEFADASNPENAIVIADRSGKHTYTFPLTYNGLPDDAMSMLPTTTMSTGIEFYYNGNLMGNNITGANGPSPEKLRLIEKIETRNLDYKLQLVEYDAAQKTAREIDANATWVNIAPVAGVDHAYNISIKQTKEYTAWENRYLYLYVLPPKYKSGYDYAANFNEKGELDKTSNKYGIRITQLGKRLEGFVLTGGLSQEISLSEPVLVTNQDLITQYGTSNIYEKAFTEAEWGVAGHIQIQVNGMWEIKHEFASWVNWLRSAPSISTYKLGLGSRKPFAQLPNEGSPIIFKDAERNNYGVLLIKKQVANN